MNHQEDEDYDLMYATCTENELRTVPVPNPELNQQTEPLDELDEQRPKLWTNRQEHITMCESGNLPHIEHLDGDGDPAIRTPWCNSATCKKCGPYLAGKIKARTVKYLDKMDRRLYRVVVDVVGDYDKFRDKLNRFINQAGAAKELYPMDDHIIIHLDMLVDFTSYGRVAFPVSPDDITWLSEINTVRRKSGNMRVEEDEKEDGLPILTDRFMVKVDKEKEAKAWAEAIIQTNINLPVYEPDMSPQQIMLIQAAYDERNARFRYLFEADGGVIHGVSRIRVSYISWNSAVSNQLESGEMTKEELEAAILARMPTDRRDRD